MRTISFNAYKFDELSDEAKENARDWWSGIGEEYFWWNEAVQSLEAFCDHFNVTIKDYSVDTWGHSYVDTDASNQNFRGLKLKVVDREQMPTGYCADCDLWYTFHDEFKRTGDALHAFNEAIDAWLKAVRSDMEYQQSDEFIDDHLTANEYEFTEDGKRI